MAEPPADLSFSEVLGDMDSAEVRAIGSVVRRAQGFDAMAEAAAILDAAGVIVDTNEAWRLVGLLNEAPPGTTGVGVDYLQVCDRAVASGAAPEAAAVADAIRSILAGERHQVDLEYRADSASEDRWYLVRASAISVGDRLGAVVVHHNVTARKLLESGLAGVGAVDTVTGLADWTAAGAYLSERLVAAATTGGRVTVMALDVDRFAAINDRLGRAAGDELLVELGARARRVVRQGDLLCRVAADRFLLVFRDVQVVDVAPMRARLIEAVSQPFRVGTTEVELRCTIGVVASADDDTVDSLLARSVAAARQGKRPDRPDPVCTDHVGSLETVPIPLAAIGATAPTPTSPAPGEPGSGGLLGIVADGEGMEGTLAAQALHVALTNLHDRRALVDNMGQALAVRTASDPPGTLLVVDVANLQRVYEGFGQTLGDRLVLRCASALQLAAHAGDLVARNSDRTFAVFCGHLGNAELAGAYAERLRDAVARPATIEGRGFAVQARVGISSTETGTDDALELLHQATTALNRTDAGTDRVRVYDQALRARALHQLDMEALVRRTIDAGRAELAYQPVVRLEDQAVEGGEALLRLTDEAGSPVNPLDVIEAADRIGATRDLSRLILTTACTEAASWREAAPGRPVLLSINVPGTLLADDQFPAMVSEITAAAGLAPAGLCLEVNESVLMEDPLRSATQLVDLKMRGFRLAVDDFGTGYSSLAHLKRFPLDILKVDHSLTRGLAHSLEDSAIVRAIIGVADALGLAVVAEGVEDEEQRRELEVLGVAYGQGYLWSGAMRPAVFASLLSADRDRRESAAEARPVVTHGSRPSTPAAGVQENLDAVLSVLAHEIRTPLSVITGYASLLEQSLGADEADAAATIVRAGQRISRILANIVDADSAMEGSLQLRLHPVDLSALVGRLVEDLAGPVARVVSYAPPVARHPVAMVDATRIEQTVNNLITNAVKYSPPGSPVLVDIDVGADWLDVAVTDEGPGIPPEQIGLIFRKYGRANGQVPGTGLGLYLARSIARAHGGEVLYRRRTDRSGSVFVLRLPRMSDPTG